MFPAPITGREPQSQAAWLQHGVTGKPGRWVRVAAELSRTVLASSLSGGFSPILCTSQHAAILQIYEEYTLLPASETCHDVAIRIELQETTRCSARYDVPVFRGVRDVLHGFSTSHHAALICTGGWCCTNGQTPRGILVWGVFPTSLLSYRVLVVVKRAV